MNKECAICAQGIGKKYLISHEASGDQWALRHVLGAKIARWFGLESVKREKLNRSASEEFWALRDVTFEIFPGERIGIIGRNGAGKSTLLKILSRITEPTQGRAVIRGRVASLLEIGTGFHYELTGRENIFLSGSILGMTQKEIQSKYDAIVSFSEVERFLDTPVKRYSSGMFVRLAFAVAVHLDPEILIIDEVLAVGDSQFQGKCLDKMEDVSKKEGRTILLVSHNMGLISKLCEKAMILAGGEQTFFGSSSEAISCYFKNEEVESNSRKNLLKAKHYNPDKPPVLLWLSLHDENGVETASFSTKKDIIIRVGFQLEQEVSAAYCHFNFFDAMHNRILTTASYHHQTPLRLPRTGFLEARIKEVPLVGDFSLDIEFGTTFPTNTILDYVLCATRLTIDVGSFFSQCSLLPGQGLLSSYSTWTVHSES